MVTSTVTDNNQFSHDFWRSVTRGRTGAPKALAQSFNLFVPDHEISESYMEYLQNLGLKNVYNNFPIILTWAAISGRLFFGTYVRNPCISR